MRASTRALIQRFLAPPPWLAAGVWCGTLIVMVALLLRGKWAAIPFHEYMGAGHRWLEHRPLYDLTNIDGFQYFPQAALIFSLFARLGWPAGDVAWRALGWACYALGLWRLTRHMLPDDVRPGFLIATILAVGPATTNLNNGQANLLLGALALHVSVELIEKRWWRAAALLAFGLALKPLIGVLVLLVWVLYRPMVWRVPIAIACAATVPWLFRDHAYVMAQYEDSLVKLGLCANPDRQFEDIRGLFTTFGLLLPQSAYLVIRAVAALACLGACARARGRCREPRATFLMTAFGLAYLVLFNPRTLGSSYAMPAAFAALLTTQHILAGHRRRAILGVAITFAWTVHYRDVPFVQLWLRPLACLAFASVLVHELIEAIPGVRREGPPASDYPEPRIPVLAWRPSRRLGRSRP